jgi:hypothetical protein
VLCVVKIIIIFLEKERRKSYTDNKRSIMATHTFPESGVTADPMKAGYPRKMLTTYNIRVQYLWYVAMSGVVWIIGKPVD